MTTKIMYGGLLGVGLTLLLRWVATLTGHGDFFATSIFDQVLGVGLVYMFFITLLVMAIFYLVFAG